MSRFCRNANTIPICEYLKWWDQKIELILIFAPEVVRDQRQACKIASVGKKLQN